MPQNQWNSTEACLQHAGANDIYWCVPASTHVYKYKTEIESLPENCLSCFNLNKFHQSRRKALFFLFLHFSFVFFIQINIYDILLNFSLFYIYFWYAAQKFSNITMLQSWIEWWLSSVRIEKVYLTLQLYRWNSMFPRWSRLWEMCMIAWETRSRRWLEARPWGENIKTWSATVSSGCQTFSIHR